MEGEAVFPESHSPPPTHGMTACSGHEVYRPPAEVPLVGFRPPYPLNLSHSYFNDRGSSSKLASNIITLADVELLGSFEAKKYQASLLEYTTKAETLPFSYSILASTYNFSPFLKFSSWLNSPPMLLGFMRRSWPR